MEVGRIENFRIIESPTEEEQIEANKIKMEDLLMRKFPKENFFGATGAAFSIGSQGNGMQWNGKQLTIQGQVTP